MGLNEFRDEAREFLVSDKSQRKNDYEQLAFWL